MTTGRSDRVIEFVLQKRSAGQHLVLLAAAILFAQGASLFGGLIGDDLNLLGNAIESSWSLKELGSAFRVGADEMTDGYLPPLLEGFKLHFFRPLFIALMKVEHLLWGLWIPGYHLTNLMLHFLVTALVYRWTADFGLHRNLRFVAALLFAVYTPNWLAVVWIAGRTETLAAVLVLSVIIFMGKFLSTRRPAHYGVSLGAFILALGSKESAVMVPFFLALAAAFLYLPQAWNRDAIKLRVMSLLPFFVLLPPYFVLRYWALDGFPLPPAGGFYYHQLSDDDFLPFLLARLYHIPFALLFQLPSVLVPPVIERIQILPYVMLPLAVSLSIVVFRGLRPPFRYFALGWIALSLAPTLNIGFNPIYYYFSGMVIAILYVKYYESFSASDVLWRRKAARVGLLALLVLSFVWGPVTSIGFVAGDDEFVDIGDAAATMLDAYPDVETVYIMDTPTPITTCVVPYMRLFHARHAAKRMVILTPGSTMAERWPSILYQLDAHTFEMEATSGTYFTSGFEQLTFASDVIDFTVGMKRGNDDYSVEILGVVPHGPARDEPSMVKTFRAVCRLPAVEQVGATRLRCEFVARLTGAGQIFLQVVPGGVEVVEFE